MDDLISRMAAIVIIRSLYPSEPYLKGNRERWRERYKHYIEAEKALKRLPSAQPRKKGKWILDTFQIRCNRCNKLFSDSLFPSKYCPNCGARMDGESDV